MFALTPGKDGAVGRDGDAVDASSRHGDDALARKGIDLLGQQLVVPVAVAQLACCSIAPAPGGAIGGEGEAVVASRYGDDALPSQGLDLLRDGSS